MTKQEEQFKAETQQEKLLWDNKVIVAIAKKVTTVNAAIEKMQDHPDFSQQLADWKEADTNIYKEAALALKYGTQGLSHPSLNPKGSTQISQSNFSQFTQPFNQPLNQSRMPVPNQIGASTPSKPALAGMATAKDSIQVAINWSGDLAGKAKGVASRINRGFSKVGNFLRGGAS